AAILRWRSSETSRSDARRFAMPYPMIAAPRRNTPGSQRFGKYGPRRMSSAAAPQRMRAIVRSTPFASRSRPSLIRPVRLPERQRDDAPHHEDRRDRSLSDIRLGERPGPKEHAEEDPDLPRRSDVAHRADREGGQHEDVRERRERGHGERGGPIRAPLGLHLGPPR